MLRTLRLWGLVCLVYFIGGQPTSLDAEEVEFNLLQINDVYEIIRSKNERLGGLSRVATIRKELLKENPNTFTVLAGDALSPSAMGTAAYEGDELAGRQMVAVLNTMGLDFATFGNHEFDLKKDQFLARLRESNFTWISSNVSDATLNPFPGVPRSRVLQIPRKHGGVVRVGLIGLTIDATKADYVRYRSPFRACLEQVDALKGHCDILVAITHLELEQDKQLAAAFPELHLILGGHEHDRQYAYEERVPYRAPVAKADFNAHSVFVHRLRFDTETHRLEIVSKLRPVDESIKDDERTCKVANYWRDLAFDGLKKTFCQDPREPIGSTQVKLDGRESRVRTSQTNLAKLIAAAIQSAAPEAQLVAFPCGAIRLDDVIQPGSIDVYTVLRLLPYKGDVVQVEIPGSLLKRLLDHGAEIPKDGGFLQLERVTGARDKGWQIDGHPLDPAAIYKVASTAYLMNGQESAYARDHINDELKKLAQQNKGDVRVALIKYLRSNGPLTAEKYPAGFDVEPDGLPSFPPVITHVR